MQLHLVRHAEAAGGEPDELRALTPAGREQARSLGASFREAGIRPDAILTSPLLRARETGTLIGREVGVEAAADNRLAPGATADTVTNAVAGRGNVIVVVGHQPDCSRIASALSGGPEPDFPPAGSFTVAL